MKTDTKRNWKECSFVVRSAFIGQRNKYSDCYHQWVLETDDDVTEDVIADYMFEYLWGHGRLPEYKKWLKEVSDSGSHFTDIYYYQEGYYDIRKDDDGSYIVTITLPRVIV